MNEERFTFHPQYKHSGMFANRKCEELFYLKNQKMCDPILVLVTLLKMRPHYSQSSGENATPSSGTSPLASFKEVPTPRDLKLSIIRIPQLRFRLATGGPNSRYEKGYKVIYILRCDLCAGQAGVGRVALQATVENKRLQGHPTRM